MLADIQRQGWSGDIVCFSNGRLASGVVSLGLPSTKIMSDPLEGCSRAKLGLRLMALYAHLWAEHPQLRRAAAPRQPLAARPRLGERTAPA